MYIRKSQRLKPYKKYDLQCYTLAWSSFELFLDAKIQIQIVMQTTIHETFSVDF